MKLLMELGERMTQMRRSKGLSREKLAQKAGLSPRFLAEVESGRGNISLTRLNDLCAALGISLSDLLAALPSARQARKKIVALIGLRGAGKTTIGKKLAQQLGLEFVELDEMVERAAGLTLQNIFEVHGEDYYRSMELEVLRNLLESEDSFVLATGGGIVTRGDTYELLRRNCITVWLKAKPADHWNRVLQQDPRPMTNYPNAMAQLQNLLKTRDELYARADYQIDTSRLGIGKSVDKIVALVGLKPRSARRIRKKERELNL